MVPRGISALALGAILALACSGGLQANPGGSDLSIQFELLENQHGGALRFQAALTISNRGAVALGSRGWELYFNFGRPILAESLPPGVSVTHVNGDLRKLSPTEAFAPLAPGESRHVSFVGQGWVVKRSEAPAGPYFVFGDGPAARAEPVGDYVIAPFLSRRQTDRMPGDRVPVPTAASLFESHERLEWLPTEEVSAIVPTPVRLEPGPGSLTLDSSWTIRHDQVLAWEAGHLAAALGAVLGNPPGTAEGVAGAANVIALRLGAVTVGGSVREAGAEAYRLTVDADAGIEIVGTDPAGVFYGIQSLRALLPIESYRRPAQAVSLGEVTVEDAPRFGYRGLHLDVSRNFHPRETVEKLLDLAAFYKLNRFHFHLTDDEGWRLEIAALSELTRVGARRGHTIDERDHLMPSYGSGPDPAISHGSGYFARADFVAMLRHARDRHIRVIPEIDVPGHARAAIKSMAARHARLLAQGRTDEATAFLLSDPEDESEYRSVQGWDDNVINVCLPSTYRFLETVVDEIVGLYAEAEAPLEVIHVGGDEVPAGVWERSPACARLIREDPGLAGVDDLASHFLVRLSEILAKRGLATAGWEEIALTETRRGERVDKVPNEAYLDRDFRPYVWNNVWGWGAEDLGYRLANAGYRVVLANATNLYFDLAYDKHPEETGYTWAGFVDTRKPWEFVPFDYFKIARADLMGRPLDAGARFADSVRPTAAGRGRILGIQGQLWSENAKGREMLEYLAFPKLLGLAERAWAVQPEWARIEEAAERERRLEADWNEFANRLGRRELARLDRLQGGVNYRLPPPGAVLRDGLLEANVAFPGLAIRYTTDGSEPTAASALYTGPTAVSGPVRLRTFDTRGRGSRAATVPGSGDPAR